MPTRNTGRFVTSTVPPLPTMSPRTAAVERMENRSPAARS
jgi:hypothetical protein